MAAENFLCQPPNLCIIWYPTIVAQRGAPGHRPWISPTLQNTPGIWQDMTMDYDDRFSQALDGLRSEGRYRVFMDILATIIWAWARTRRCSTP
jgi:hypothetical protein